MRFKINSKKSEFKETSFEDLTEKLIEDSLEVKKNKIKENLESHKLEFPSIAYLYMGITRIASSFLVDHENDKSNLEEGYSNILKLISKTLKVETIQPKNKNGQIDNDIRDRQLQSLWKNREQLNETMSHYVRQIQNLREKEDRRITQYLSSAAIIISIILPFILNYFLP